MGAEDPGARVERFDRGVLLAQDRQHVPLAPYIRTGAQMRQHLAHGPLTGGRLLVQDLRRDVFGQFFQMPGGEFQQTQNCLSREQVSRHKVSSFKYLDSN